MNINLHYILYYIFCSKNTLICKFYCKNQNLYNIIIEKIRKKVYNYKDTEEKDF